MCSKITFVGSTNKTKNDRAQEALGKIPWIKVDWIAPFRLLDELEEVPYIHTDEGDRYFGVDDIEYFVEGMLLERQ